MSGELVVEFPRDGDVLNRHDGEQSSEGLRIQLRGRAWPGAVIRAGGVEATADADGRFALPVVINQREQSIEVVATSDGKSASATVRVVWDSAGRKRFRFSVDDNILWLRDLAENPDKFASIFDHWYLDFFRAMHRRYGAKIHMNIYWTDLKGFTLRDMPDKWREEFRDNADWLHLTFHARADLPPRPYKDAGYDELARDIAMVHEQIERFAGPEVMSVVTTIHWAETTRDGARAVRDAGYRGLIILASEPAAACTTRYYLPDDLVSHVARRDAWKDFDLDILFIQCDAVVNKLMVTAVESHLRRAAENPHTGELLELLIHEQYYRPDLPQLYQPDILEKTERAIRFAVENGYEPVFWGEEFFPGQRL